jgi:hypothetical protein
MSEPRVHDRFSTSPQPHDLFRQFRSDLTRRLSSGRPRQYPADWWAAPYPSPPMSNPPSPPKTQSTSLPAITTQPQLLTSTSSQAGNLAEVSRTFANSASLVQSEPSPTHTNDGSLHPHSTSAPSTTLSTYAAQLYSHVTGPPSNEPESVGSAAPLLRGSRRSKTHVASACINCKRAHLSCDVQRPCARCVASGKQVSCACNVTANETYLTRRRTPASTFSTRSVVGHVFAKISISRLNKRQLIRCSRKHRP